MLNTNHYTKKFFQANKRNITATFTNGKKVNYTVNVLGLLLTDENVILIEETETGNILFYK